MREKILYSGGCRFCRWVARTIVPRLFPQFDIIPFREPEAMVLLKPDIPFSAWTSNWHYVTVTGNVVYATWIALSILLPRWLVHNWIVFGLAKVDRWVKHHRHILSSWVPDGPAIKKVDGHITMIYNYGKPERFEV